MKKKLLMWYFILLTGGNFIKSDNVTLCGINDKKAIEKRYTVPEETKKNVDKHNCTFYFSLNDPSPHDCILGASPQCYFDLDRQMSEREVYNLFRFLGALYNFTVKKRGQHEELEYCILRDTFYCGNRDVMYFPKRIHLFFSLENRKYKFELDPNVNYAIQNEFYDLDSLKNNYFSSGGSSLLKNLSLLIFCFLFFYIEAGR